MTDQNLEKKISRPDIFAGVWDKLRLKLELNPEKTAKSLMEELVERSKHL